MVISMSCITVVQDFSTFSLAWVETGWPGQGSFSTDSLLSLKCTSYRVTCAQLRVITIHILQVFIHFHGSFPQFKVKFNYCMLLHVRTSDTRNTHTHQPTLTVIKWLLLLERQAHADGQNHVIFGNLCAGHSEKNRLLIYWAHLVCIQQLMLNTDHNNFLPAHRFLMSVISHNDYVFNN